MVVGIDEKSYFAVGIIRIFIFHVLVEFLFSSSSFLFFIVFLFDNSVGFKIEVEVEYSHGCRKGFNCEI